MAKAPFNLSFIPYPQLKQGAIEDAGRMVGIGIGNLIGDFQWDCALVHSLENILAKAPFNLLFIQFPQLKQGAIEDSGRDKKAPC